MIIPGRQERIFALSVLVFCQLFFSIALAQEADTFVIRSPEDAARFDARYLFLQKLSSGATVLVDSIRTTAYEKRFVRYHPDSADCRYCVYWGKFYLKNALSSPGLLHDWILKFYDASFIDVYMFDTAGRQVFYGRTGKLVPARDKNVRSGFRASRVRFSLADTAVFAVYFRYKRVDGFKAEFKSLGLAPRDIYALSDQLAFWREDSFFMGFLLTVLLFNLLFFAGTGDRVFAYQAVFLLAVLVLMCQTTGFTHDVPGFRDHPFYIITTSYTAAIVLTMAYIKFIRAFTGLRTLLPGWDRLMQYLLPVNLVVLMAVLLTYIITSNELACDRALTGFICAEYLVLTYLIISLHRTKERVTYFLTGAALLVIIGALVNVISIFEGTSIQMGVIKWVVSGNITLFFLGLAYRMKKLEVQKQESLRLKAVNDLKNQLITNITHEFRTPLTVIAGMAAQIGRKPQVTGEKTIQKALDLIHQNGGRLLRLVNQMLDLARLESGQMELALHRGDAVAQLRHLVRSFEAYSLEKNIHLQFLTELPALEMDYDSDKFQQVVSNLLFNAIKFTPAGGQIFVSARLDNQQEGKTLVLVVADTGGGIPPDELPHIFDRFYQGKNSKKAGGGTGIGLALSRELVKLMGGTISVQSTPGSGSSFTVRLPVLLIAGTPAGNAPPSPVEAEKLAEPILLETGLAGPGETSKPLVLLIEDHVDTVYYLRTLLEDQYEVEAAYNGDAGIECALETVPDILISDVMMPGKDGFEVCETLKGDPRTSHIPIVLLTAKASHPDRIEGLKRGADVYLTKPFSEEELLVCLENLLQTRKRLLERYAHPEFPDTSDDPGVRAEDAFVRALRKEVEKHMHDEHFGILQLCQALQMSRTQLHRKITALTGNSTSHYIRSVRLYRARDLLKTSADTVSEVAYAVGFSDPNYFTRTFTAEFGEAPSSFRL